MRKALIIGINDYDFLSSLSWCENDAIGMSNALERHASGDPNFSVELLTTNSTESVTSKKGMRLIRELFAGEAETALLYFAGHGGFNEDMSEGVICFQDYSNDDNEGEIRLSDILQLANASKTQNKVIILDSCQAGGAGQLRNLPPQSSLINDGVTILAACQKEGYASENSLDKHGLFTGLLLEGLLGGAVNILGKVTPGSLYSFVDNALDSWEQRPVFKTNVSRFISLRDNLPLVSKDILRKLPVWFKNETDIYSLDPTFEPDRKNIPEEFRDLPINEKKTQIFKELQKCNRHGLIIPHDVEHMYDAAIQSTGCKLTALGAYYRKMSIKGRI